MVLRYILKKELTRSGHGLDMKTREKQMSGGPEGLMARPADRQG